MLSDVEHRAEGNKACQQLLENWLGEVKKGMMGIMRFRKLPLAPLIWVMAPLPVDGMSAPFFPDTRPIWSTYVVIPRGDNAQ